MKSPSGTAPLSAFLLASIIIIANFPVAAGASETDTSKTPKGLSASDWSGIRGAYEKNRHAIAANPDGSHQARNPGQAWLTKFDGRGFTVTPDVGGWTWGLELAGYGDATDVIHEGGKISYVREDGLTEWFINDTRGLEQGWILAKRPERAGNAGPLRLDLSVRGGLRPQVSPEGASVAFLNESGGAALTYGGLKAWDADGKTVQVRFTEGEGVEKGLGVVVNDEGARYPITVDPIAQQAFLTASNADSNDYFGYSVAISGNTVLVGAPLEASSASGVNGNQFDNSRPEAGAAYVFVKSEDGWIQQAYLKGQGAFWERFGEAVGISGNTIVVGAYGYKPYGGINTGGAYVFTRTGESWVLQTTLIASNAEGGDFFGGSVAVDGNTIVVGAIGEKSKEIGTNGNQNDNSAAGAGAAYVFVRNGTAWSQQAYLKASNTGFGDNFGKSVAISDDTVVIGAYGEGSGATGVNSYQNDNSAEGAGAAYVFVRSGTTWAQQAYLKASNTAAHDSFGLSVAISGDTVVVGAYAEDSSANEPNGNETDNSSETSGAAYVFVRNGNGWNQQAYLKASNSDPGDCFGTSVAVSGDMVIVGATGEDSNATGVNGNQSDNSVSPCGAAYVFKRMSGIWSQLAYLKPSTTDNNDFGRSVAISGNKLVIGSAYDKWGTPQAAGASYVFERSFTLTANASHGSILGTGDYQENSTAALSVTTNAGYVFTGWTGDASGSDNPLTVLMDADKTITATFGPDTNDPDDDGLTNYQEIVEKGTNPTLRDTDGDNVKDGNDAFPLDINEWLDTDQDGIGDNADTDDDGDGLSDVDEINIHGTNPKRSDSDGDGLSDPQEIQTHLTNPNIADTDSDGLSDGAEVNTHGTLPKVADTDGDGFLDGYEFYTGKSPLNDQDKPALVAEARTAIEFTFPSALGKTYRIEDSLDLTTWGTVESGIAGNGGQIQRFYTTRGMPMRYFRVEEDGPQ